MRHIFACSTFYLLVGILVPSMEMAASKNSAFLSGPLIFNAQSKGIASIIVGLLGSGNAGNWILGRLVGLFSVVTPLIKLGLSNGNTAGTTH